MILYFKKMLYIFPCTVFALFFISFCGCAAPAKTAYMTSAAPSAAVDVQGTQPTADTGMQNGLSSADADMQDTQPTADAGMQNGLSSADADTQDTQPTADAGMQNGLSSADADMKDTQPTADSGLHNDPAFDGTDTQGAASSVRAGTGNSSSSADANPQNTGTNAGSSTAPQSMEDLYSQILSCGTKAFFGGHPADTAFFKWLSSKYGSACIKKLARAAGTSSQKPSLWHKLTGNSIHVLWLLYCRKSGIQPGQLKNVTWQDCASDKETTLAFTGDLNFSEGYSTTSHLDSCRNGIYDCFSKDLLELMNHMDIMMLNNEFTYSTRGTPLPGKAFTFRAHPSRAGLLKAFGTDIVNLANNHVYDYGPDALLDTIATLDQEGIPHIGAGADLKKAAAPYYFVCNGRKIAFVAATQIERSTSYTKEATKDTPGVLKTLNPDKFTAAIKKAKKNSDYVIAIVHWGTEGSSYYAQDQRDLAKAFVDAGADAVVGGHTHCLQGFEFIDGVPVLYSTGNFWFSRRTQDTGLAKITISRSGKLTMSFIPCIQENLRTYLVTDKAQRQRILTFLQNISAPDVRLTKKGTVKISVP